MTKFLTIHEETDVDRVRLESRWTEIAADPRADSQMTLFNMDLGERFCEWDAPSAEILEEIFRELNIKWTEILEVDVTAASKWRLWEIESGRRPLNCWEIMKCGRESAGAEGDDRTVCPAARDEASTGKNRGMYAGGYCWHIVGAFCDGEPEGNYAKKMRDCALCGFFQQVK